MHSLLSISRAGPFFCDIGQGTEPVTGTRTISNLVSELKRARGSISARAAAAPANATSSAARLLEAGRSAPPSPTIFSVSGLSNTVGGVDAELRLPVNDDPFTFVIP